MYTYLYEYLIKGFCSYTYQCHGLICALPILSAGVNDIGRLFKCFSPPNSLPFCSIICFICSLFQSSSLDGHAYCSPYLTDFLFWFICNRLVSFYGCVVIWSLWRTIFISIGSFFIFLDESTQTSQWQRSACTSRSTTPTILRFTLFVVNTSFTAIVPLWSNHHRSFY